VDTFHACPCSRRVCDGPALTMSAERRAGKRPVSDDKG
jgi:hypothetical protein